MYIHTLSKYLHLFETVTRTYLHTLSIYLHTCIYIYAYTICHNLSIYTSLIRSPALHTYAIYLFTLSICLHTCKYIYAYTILHNLYIYTSLIRSPTLHTYAIYIYLHIREPSIYLHIHTHTHTDKHTYTIDTSFKRPPIALDLPNDIHALSIHLHTHTHTHTHRQTYIHYLHLFETVTHSTRLADAL